MFWKWDKKRKKSTSTRLDQWYLKFIAKTFKLTTSIFQRWFGKRDFDFMGGTPFNESQNYNYNAKIFYVFLAS